MQVCKKFKGIDRILTTSNTLRSFRFDKAKKRSKYCASMKPNKTNLNDRVGYSNSGQDEKLVDQQFQVETLAAREHQGREEKIEKESRKSLPSRRSCKQTD